MNEFGRECKTNLCNRIETTESLVKSLEMEMRQFLSNQHAEFTDDDRNALDYAIKKTGEAIECLHLSLLNLKNK